MTYGKELIKGGKKMYDDRMFKRKASNRSKNITSSVKWNRKNEYYLKRLGFLDDLGHARRNISGFVNMCVMNLLEDFGHKSPSEFVSPDDLARAFRKACASSRQKQISRLNQEIQSISDWDGVE